ncbi:ferrous iron transport protein B [Helicobacter sp. 16-1353]|uniref:ferrous iron transport protein B n=1 Tax=Helicobacter sp. 16-1353 TaxID=2004996 RepID=UPI000DCC274E|nr:ferrous iron transport protein B [Helicobacter sp. 16-1353]RAX51706.1 ferrous iron transport protein B [Helicobacter sp. 16-1353]
MSDEKNQDDSNQIIDSNKIENTSLHKSKIKVALAGQPNCGKSTVFNMISGIRQHIANYPGVTVDKKSGHFSYKNNDIEVVDLPGTYSFSSYSLEEKVAKEFIINENPDIILNIIDASNIKRNLYLTFQLLEIGKPVIVVLNMCDVAKNRGIKIDTAKIAGLLNCPVIEASAAKGVGKEEILEAIINSKNLTYTNFRINYDELESYIAQLEGKIRAKTQNLDSRKNLDSRWLAIKALEGDSFIINILQNMAESPAESPAESVAKSASATESPAESVAKSATLNAPENKTNNAPEKITESTQNISDEVENLRADFHNKFDKDIEHFLANIRYDSADIIYHKCIKETKKGQKTLTDKVDRFVLNRWLSFPILLLIIFIIYEASIVGGYKLTNYTWPILATLKNFVIDISPAGDITHVPMTTDLAIWLINSVNALLNYIPIFLILFSLIAILEDIGYMPRMAFILDRVFRKFGLHGQSTLPLVLGGAFVGGCAVPGIMSTKGIADDRARMATILTVPLMNCLAKVPFYTLLVGAFFAAHMSLMLFYISTITIFAALIIAKILTSTILQTRQTAPFVMELPPYHLPTFKGVILRALERVWVYIKKVCTIVLAVAIILFAMLQFPGLSKEKQDYYNGEEAKILAVFDKKVKKTKYYEMLDSREKVANALNVYENYRGKKMTGGSDVDEVFEKKYPEIYKFIKVPKGDKDARVINTELRKLSNGKNKILREQKNDKIENSLLGMAGRALEPISKFAGFDWKINVAFLSSFAARESAVATLGSIYEQGKSPIIENVESGANPNVESNAESANLNVDSTNAKSITKTAESSVNLESNANLNTDSAESNADLSASQAQLRPEEAMAQNSGYTPLHAASIIIFMLLTPPCIATMIVLKMQTNSWLWMIFALLFPFSLALIVSSLFFTISNALNLGGLEAMSFYYAIVLIIALILGFIPEKRKNWSGGLSAVYQSKEGK